MLISGIVYVTIGNRMLRLFGKFAVSPGRTEPSIAGEFNSMQEIYDDKERKVTKALFNRMITDHGLTVVAHLSNGKCYTIVEARTVELRADKESNHVRWTGLWCEEISL